MPGGGRTGTPIGTSHGRQASVNPLLRFLPIMVASAAFIAMSFSAIAVGTRQVGRTTMYQHDRTPPDDPTRLGRFLECTRNTVGAESDQRPFWCAMTDRCVSDAGECPPESARCGLPLLLSGDRLYDPVGITNQKLNIRDVAAVARVVGGALLVSKVRRGASCSGCLGSKSCGPPLSCPGSSGGDPRRGRMGPWARRPPSQHLLVARALR